jgi:O-Antigen ligase.
VIERSPKILFAAASVLGMAVLGYFAYFRPGYFISQTYLGGLVLLELLIAALWLYRRAFFPMVIVTFLLAGINMRMGSVWTMARWGVLGMGAAIGLLLVLKEKGHQYKFGVFHVMAVFAVLTALVSAEVSPYTALSLLKVLSLALLFLYSATGARLAVTGRENRFFSGLLLGCEVFVAVIAALYLFEIHIMGNPNSLGAVMGVVAAPILLWGILLKENGLAHRRHLLFFTIAMYLTFASNARAAMLAALVVCGLLCLTLRRYRLFAQGITLIVVVAATAALVQPEEFSWTVHSITTEVLYKGKDADEGLLSSRTSPWGNTLDSIQKHFWFGTGFGTSDTGRDATPVIGNFSSNSSVTTEHGSSYLAVTSWVGMFGALPFALLLIILLGKIVQTLIWMYRTGNPAHPVVPLAMVLIAGLTHAFFEDWLFAPGYYLCVFFWTMAFVFEDQVRSLTALDARSLVWSRVPTVQPQLGAVVSSR